MKSKIISLVMVCMIAGLFSCQNSTGDQPANISGTKASSQQNTEVYLTVSDAPKFPGGDYELNQFIIKNVKYPPISQENGIQGRVVCSFIVEKDGSLTNVDVVKGVDPELDKEAMRVIASMPAWTPGKNNGTIVRVRSTLPINFRLVPDLEETQNNNHSATDDTIFTVVQNPPEYPGGESAMLNFMQDYIQKEIKDEKIGRLERVILTFVVEPDGSLSNIEVIRGVNPVLDKIAVESINYMPKWQPGTQDGIARRVQFTLPVQFKPNV